jgi:hypothetical protein
MMSRKWIVGVALIGALAVPVAGWAHGGHTHKVMGTVSSIEGNHVIVKTTDGKTTMVVLDAKTNITRGKATLTAADVRIGDRIVAEGAQERDTLTAKTLHVGTAPAAATAKK